MSRRLYSTVPAIALSALLLPLVTEALKAQCSDSSTYIYAQSTTTRLNGNTVKLYNDTEILGRLL